MRAILMTMLNPYDVIVKPVVTEKTMRGIERLRAYLFVVRPDATKPQIRRAVEQVFNVKVERVRTLLRKGKRHVRKAVIWTRRPDQKCAVVTLQEGHRIDIL